MLRLNHRRVFIVAALLLFPTILLAQRWKDDPDKVGHFAVGNVSYMLTDHSNGDRPVSLMVWYPVNKSTINSNTPPAQYPFDPYFGNMPVTMSTDWERIGYDSAYDAPAPSPDRPFPLLVFSPGASLGAWQYIYLGVRLASHGYVVAVAEHANDCSWPWTGCDRFVNRMGNRVRDVSFIISELLRRNRTRHELLFRSIDSNRIAVAGHSLGGYPAYSLAAGDAQVCDTLWPALVGADSLPYDPKMCIQIPRDRQVKLIISLDGASHFFHYDELSKISIPNLIIGQTVDQEENFGILKTWMARPHAAINRLDSYRADINGANHQSFSDYCDGWQVLFNRGDISGDELYQRQNSWPCTDTGWNPTTISSKVAHDTVTKYMLAFLDLYFHNPDSNPLLNFWILTEPYALTHTPTVQFFNFEYCRIDVPDETYFRYRTYQKLGECGTDKKDPTGWFVSE